MSHRLPSFREFASAVVLLAMCLPSVAQKAQTPARSIAQIEAEIKANPGSPKLYVALGLAHWDRNNYPQALAAFQQAVKVGPASAEAHNWLGVAIMEKADLPGAITEFRRAVALNPRYARAQTNLGSALAKSGELAEAVKAFRKALALEPGNMAAHMNLGVALREKGDAEGALVQLRQVAAADANNPGVQYELGQTLRQSGDLAGAAAAFQNALRINPELREGYYGLGLVLKQLGMASSQPGPTDPSPADELVKQGQDAAAHGDLETARDRLTRAVGLDDTNAQAYNLLGFVLGQQGDIAEALVHLQRAIALQPNYAEAHYNLGAALWYSGSRDHAIPELRESLRLNPAGGASYAFLGTSLRETGDLDGARKNLQCAIALLPPMPALYVDLGVVYLRKGDLDKALGQLEAGLNAAFTASPAPDYDNAIAGLRELLAKDPKRADGHNVLGLLLGRKGAPHGEVEAEFREAIRLRPDFAQAYDNLGLVLVQSGDDTDAIAAFRAAIRIQPNYADAHANLGAVLTPSDNEQAIRELEQATTLSPELVKAQFNLAEAYGANPSYGPAKQIEQLRKVVAAAPTFARGHQALGKALLQDGKMTEAVAELEEAVRLDPQSGESHYQLGLALARAGRKEEGNAEVQKGRELSAADDRNQNASLDIAEGQSALDKGELEQAAAKFQHAIKLQPDSADAQRYLGTVLEKQGDTSRAVAAYRKAIELNQGDVSARRHLQSLTKDEPVDDDASISEFEGYIKDGKFKEVEPLLATYVEQRPKSAWGWYALGYSRFAQQKIGASIQALANSLQLDVKNAEAHKILGRDLMLIGRFDAAQVEFEQGIQYSPQSAEIHYNLGKLFSMQDNWGPARKEFEAARQIAPAYIENLDALGMALEALGDDAGAVANYEKAISLNETQNGQFASAHVNLSAYYNRTGHPEKGLELAQKALELDPRSDRAWFQKAKAEETEGRLNEAVDALNQAISFNPRASSYYYVLSGFYRRLGKKQDSQKALEAFMRLDQETKDLDKMRRTSANPAPAAPAPRGPNE